MYATLAGILLTPVALGALAWWLHQPPARPAPRATQPAAARARPGGAMTAATLGAQPAGLTSRGRGGGDAQGRAATNPVAALPCARTPLPGPLRTPLLRSLLHPSSATVGVLLPARAPFRLVGGTDPGRSRAGFARDRPGSGRDGKRWRATGSGLHAGALVPGRPPTNPVGGLPPASPGHPGHEGWSRG
jgi:hypothetical protein